MSFLFSGLRVLFYCVVGAVLIIVGAAIFFMTWEPDRADFAFRGIDVSHHNGPINWSRVASDDVAFVYIKATEGKDFSDPAFLRNWQGANASGLAVGAYHYFSFCSSGEEQAENFLAHLPHNGPMLPPALDLELTEGSDCPAPEAADVRREIAAFVQNVELRLQAKLVLYAPEDFYLSYLKDAGVNRPIWVRSLWQSPFYAPNWVFWQYHARGSISGIEGDVDLNVLATRRELSDLLIK